MFWNNKYPYTDFSQINLDMFVRMLASLFEAKKNSGGFIPAIKASDENKVLTVKNGIAVWESIEPEEPE